MGFRGSPAQHQLPPACYLRSWREAKRHALALLLKRPTHAVWLAKGRKKVVCLTQARQRDVMTVDRRERVAWDPIVRGVINLRGVPFFALLVGRGSR